MTSTNTRIFLAAFALAGVVAVAEQSASEKGSAATNDAVRKVKKMGHRAEEAMCAEGDAKCLAKKGKHRADESSDYVKDKAKEVGDKIDSDSAPGK
jgi:hypothetical protein